MAPSSGCAIESANQLVVEVARSSIATGIGCIGDKAAVTTGPVLTQVGPPDASIWTSTREGDEWGLTDTGTGIEGHLAFPIVPFATWSQWPESTMPGFESSLGEPTIAIEPHPTVEAFTDAVLATLGTLDIEPESPLNQRLVATQPDGQRGSVRTRRRRRPRALHLTGPTS